MDAKDSREELDPFRKVTHCNICPCMNTDVEDGSWCNLDYSCEFYWTPDGGLIDGSEDCGLMFIKVCDKEIIEIPLIIARKRRTDGR